MALKNIHNVWAQFSSVYKISAESSKSQPQNRGCDKLGLFLFNAKSAPAEAMLQILILINISVFCLLVEVKKMKRYSYAPLTQRLPLLKGNKGYNHLFYQQQMVGNK